MPFRHNQNMHTGFTDKGTFVTLMGPASGPTRTLTVYEPERQRGTRKPAAGSKETIEGIEASVSAVPSYLPDLCRRITGRDLSEVLHHLVDSCRLSRVIYNLTMLWSRWQGAYLL